MCATSRDSGGEQTYSPIHLHVKRCLLPFHRFPFLLFLLKKSETGMINHSIHCPIHDINRPLKPQHLNSHTALSLPSVNLVLFHNCRVPSPFGPRFLSFFPLILDRHIHKTFHLKRGQFKFRARGTRLMIVKRGQN